MPSEMGQKFISPEILAIDAVDQGLNVIDAGHYGIEHIFIGQMAEELKERFPEMEICTEPIRHPFLMV